MANDLVTVLCAPHASQTAKRLAYLLNIAPSSGIALETVQACVSGKLTEVWRNQFSVH